MLELRVDQIPTHREMGSLGVGGVVRGPNGVGDDVRGSICGTTDVFCGLHR